MRLIIWLRFVFPCPQLFPDAFAVLFQVVEQFRVFHSVHACRALILNDLQIRRIEILYAQYGYWEDDEDKQDEFKQNARRLAGHSYHLIFNRENSYTMFVGQSLK